MSKSWKILEWDYVLDTENAKIPQFTFLPTPNFITSADLNINNLLITIYDTSCGAYNKKNVKGVVDKSTQIINENSGEVISASQGQPCQSDFSQNTVLYTMTLPGVCYLEGVKNGKFSLMSEYKKPESKEEGEKEEGEKEEGEKEEGEKEEGEKEEGEKEGETGEDPNKSLPILPLALIGGVLATALLTIFLIRNQ